MNICACCREKLADKKNTHYLTDGIIRSCLNEQGSNTREKGMMFNVSYNKDSVEAKFQRETSQGAILETFGREATDKEIEEAMQIPFSVDYVFCSTCEDLFTDIETRFQEEILPQLRGKDFTGQPEISLADTVLVRQFFLLQVYRTAVCDPDYKIDSKLFEQLRLVILNRNNEIEAIQAFPLNVTYLNTVGSDYEYTKNAVGIAEINGQKMILFNDFTIQLIETPANYGFEDFYGVNDRATFKYFTNLDENAFRLKVLDNKQRLAVWGRYHQEKAKKQMDFYRRTFTFRYLRKHHRPPAIGLVRAFIIAIIDGKEFNDEPQYSMARFERLADKYLELK